MAVATTTELRESLGKFAEACEWFAEQAAKLEKVRAVTAGWHGDYADLWTLLEPWDFDTEGEVIRLLMQLTPRYPHLRFDSHITIMEGLPQRHTVLYVREGA